VKRYEALETLFSKIALSFAKKYLTSPIIQLILLEDYIETLLA
jgi:hypothetical protein